MQFLILDHFSERSPTLRIFYVDNRKK